MRAILPLSLLVLGACTPAEPASTAHQGPPTTPSHSAELLPAVAAADWDYIGPGGMGAFSAVKAHPHDPDLLVAGSDVGGSFVSWDGGQSWQVGQHVHEGEDGTISFHPLEVHDIGVGVHPDGRATWYLATAEGVFRSELGPPGQPPRWHLRADLPPIHSAINGDLFRQSVQVVTVNPDDPLDLWVGMGRGPEPNIDARARHQPYKILRSRDGGLSWVPLLSVDEATVFSITLDPEDPERAWAGTNRGLFATEDGGASWVELGVSDPHRTEDAGASWQSCEGNPDCPEPLRELACAPEDDCLPIAWNAGESQPNLRDVTVLHHDGQSLLYAAVWDRSHADLPQDQCLGAGFTFDDDLEITRTGPWVSEDGGATWRWLLLGPEGEPLLRWMSVRCNAASGERFTHTNLPFLRVDPDDPGHIIAGAHGVNRGIYVLRDGQWTWASLDAHFEGGASQGISGHQLGPAVLDLEVDWSTGEVLLTHTRGLLRGSEGADGRWSFENLAHHPVGETSWRTHGLDNTCPLDLAFSRINGGEALVMAVPDGGVIRSEDGVTWDNLAEAWLDLGVLPADSYAALTDPDTDFIYVTNSPKNPVSHVLQSRDGGETWEFLGAHHPRPFTGPVPTDRRLLSLAIDYRSPRGRRGLLVGTEGDGILLFETAPRGRWVHLDACPRGIVRDLQTDPAFPEFAYAAIDTGTASQDGIWAIHLRRGTCTRLDPSPTTCTVCRPTAFDFAHDGGQWWLVAGTRGDWNRLPPQQEPRVWARPINPGSPQAGVSWEHRLDPRDWLNPAHPWFDLYWQHANSRPIASVRASTANPAVVVVSAKGNPFFDGFSAPQAFVSQDGGRSFQVLATPPVGANIHRFVFDPYGEHLYALTACNAAWRTAVGP